MENKTYLIHQENKEDYRVINQTGVRQAFTNEPRHNAAWDGHLTPDGKLYFSVCSELTVGEYAKLYTYDYEKNENTECFYTKDFLLKSDRYIRDSKFHTSINTLPDGRLIMVTHTTDKSPCHPAWLPYAFVSNVWEGFAGAELMIYDPKTGKVEQLGIPAPRESIYGAVYSPKDNAYYMLGYMRGHLYRYDLTTRKCEDKGQVSEYHCYRVTVGPDQNIYWSTRSGFIMRYNLDTRKIEDMNVRIPCDKGIHDWPFTYMGPAPIGPDGRMYLTGNFTDKLSAYDVKTGKIEYIGKLIPADEYVDHDAQHAMIPGMSFDKDGVLWYSIMSFRDNEDVYYCVPAILCRWDVLHGGKPEALGVFGTVERAQIDTVSVFIDKKKDILYSVSTNHSYHSPDVIAIDLAKFRPVCGVKGPICEDNLIYAPGAEEHHEFAQGWHDTKAAIRKYTSAIHASHITPVRLWKSLSLTDFENTAIREIHFTEKGTLEGICGKTAFYRFEITEGQVNRMESVTAEEAEKSISRSFEPVENLPCYPGRQWRRNITAECEWLNGSRIVGTEDGFLARVDPDGSVFSIGPAVCQGPIRALAFDKVHEKLYGVGGDVEDIGNLFTYDEKAGLLYKGYMASDAWNDDIGACANFIPSAIAISPDGSRVAVGGADRLACVFICEF